MGSVLKNVLFVHSHGRWFCGAKCFEKCRESIEPIKLLQSKRMLIVKRSTVLDFLFLRFTMAW